MFADSFETRLWNRAPETTWWPPPPAGDLLRVARNVVPVVGAGFSARAGLPVGSQLGAWLAERFEAGHDGKALPVGRLGDCTYIASAIVGTSRSPGAKEREVLLNQRVAEYYDLDTHGAAPRIAAWSLVRVPSRIVITLNYDDVLEHAAHEQGIRYRQLTHLDLDEATQLLVDEGEPDVLAIIHVHGVRSKPETIILSAVGYQQLRKSKSTDSFWEMAARAKRLCFMGMSMNEPYLTETLARIEGGSAQHVFIADTPTLDAIEGRLPVDLVSHGVHKVALPVDEEGQADYSTLDSIAWQMSGYARRVTEGGTLLRRDEREMPAFYTETALVEHAPGRDEATGSLLAEWDFTGNRRWRAMFGHGQKQYSEKDVALEPRALVIGEPGAGKSELLRSLARQVPSGTTPLLIRLSDVPLDPGDPAIVFARWAERGRALDDDVWISPDRVREQDFQMLLDGLDEVAAGARGAVVRRISELAEALPRHRFTVTTRPMEGLESFPSDQWPVIWMIPTHRWQDAYLRKRELDWTNDIAPSLRGINDAREILRLPFFLSRVLDMRDRGTLADREDLFGLLQALVEDALEREVARLALRPQDARTWLRRVALAMLLAGRSTLSAEALSSIPLPASVEASTEEVCDILVQRLMLRPALSAGEIGFTHRFFGACLAAEALEEHGPTSTLLAALAPDRSELIRGVRADAVVPLSLVMSRNAAWRAALRGRDPVAAARSVSSRTPADERAAAARTLWERYRHWRVWIWDHHRPEIAEDARSLGRMLADHAAPELVEEIRAAIHDPDPVMQGNALAVLAFAGFADIQDELVEILGDPDRDPVVRRQAALAADRLGLPELLPLIVARATGAVEDTETQDCSIVAMNLAPDAELIDIAMTLVSSGRHSAQAIALSHVQRRGTPSDVVALLAASARAGGDGYSSEKDTLRDAAEQISEVDAKTIEDAAYLAALWSVHDEALLAMLAKDPAAKARGIASALQDGVYAFQLGVLSADASHEAMTEARWPDEVIETVLARRETAPRPADQSTSAWTEEVPTPDPEPTLAELLERERDEAVDGLLAHNSRYFARQAGELSDGLRDKLSRRLDDWWPERRYADTITWKPRHGGGRSWSQVSGAAAWVAYGPAIDKTLTPRQWAEIVSSGVAPFDDQVEWLQRRASAEAVELLPDLLTSSQGELWYPAMRSIPPEMELPQSLIDASVERLRDAQDYEIVYIADRLERWAPGTIARLSARSQAFADVLRPLLARRGDEQALRVLLAELRGAIESGGPVDADELRWLDGLGAAPRWLDDLFSCVAAAWRRPPTGRPGQDVAGPLMDAIFVISTADPDEVVRRYDELLAQGDPYHWLRRRREEVVETALGVAGEQAGPAAADTVGLPWLTPPPVVTSPPQDEEEL